MNYLRGGAERWFDEERLFKTSNSLPFPTGFFTNFDGRQLWRYEKAIQYLNDPAIVLKRDRTYSPQNGVLTDTPGRHSIWYGGKMYAGPYGRALNETLDALRVKHYMPPHGVGYYEAELLPHTGSLRFRMDIDVWKEKYNAGMDGYGPHPIVFNYPTQQHKTMLRLAEVMNEPGDGSEVFVLILHENVWHICRDHGRETVARFPFSDVGYMGLIEHGMSSALTATYHLNRGNDYIPVPPRPVPFQQQLKEAFINFKKFALISGDLISARIAV